VVEQILRLRRKGEDLIQYVTDRPGHDRRYAIDNAKIRDELGWQPRNTFETALAKTVDWYVKNREWWQRVRSGAYRDYYDRQYGQRLGIAEPRRPRWRRVLESGGFSGPS
jgi:dTDP-glucose 4,6-dehydratase